jgi:bifunctional DNase/RNase
MIDLLCSGDDPGTVILAAAADSLASDSRGSPADGSSRASSERYVAVPVQMELMRIIINENSDQHIIFLKEVEGDRMFPIVIGIFEASSIDRRVKNQPTQRPLTHDLLANAIELMGGELQDIYINELREHTYFAKLRIRHEGELVEVDSRPSDAIALAVTVDVPIYVAEDIIDEVGQ